MVGVWQRLGVRLVRWPVRYASPRLTSPRPLKQSPNKEGRPEFAGAQFAGAQFAGAPTPFFSRLSRAWLALIVWCAAPHASPAWIAAEQTAAEQTAAEETAAEQTAAENATRARTEFFERHVRPLFLKRCVECHGAETHEGGLRLDNRQGGLAGGKHGVPVVGGDPEASLMIRAVRYQDDELQMPPDAPLTLAEQQILVQWVGEGAYWPADGRKSNSAERALNHWAFQPIQSPPPPRIDGVRHPIDAFVQQALRQQSLAPSPPADRRTLIRRAYLDLTGLPPTYEQVEAFAADPVAQPLDRLVEQLLESRQYAEHWARHWLDVARYADTKGYVDGGQAGFAFAYTYRDYVIRALQEDLPFDEFITDQIAADYEPLAADQQWRMAGMGFLTVGRRFNHNMYDTIDDQIDVVTRGLMGLTVTCARCHDHKYDPIPTADYYGMYGILASSLEPLHRDLPFTNSVDAAAWAESLAATGDADQDRQPASRPGSPPTLRGTQGAAEAGADKKSSNAEPKSPAEELREYEQLLRQRATEYEKKVHELHAVIAHELRAFAGDYLVYIVQESPRHREGSQNPLKTERTLLRGPSAYGYGAIRRWRTYVEQQTSDDPLWGVWRSMEAVSRDDFAAALTKLLREPDFAINPVLRKALDDARPTSMVQLARCYGNVLEAAYADSQAKPTVDTPDGQAVRDVLFRADSPAVLSFIEAVDCYHLDEHTSMRNAAGSVEEVSLKFAPAPPRAMILRDADRLYDPVVFVRGQPDRPGTPVARHLPGLLASVSEFADPQAAIRHRSGRAELAAAVIDRKNPLTARVLVNRVWQWHFGQALVTTVSDFGLRSEPPSHPALLDHLATEFMAHGWSLKWLHRYIMSSHTYQQASRDRADAEAVDAQNRWLWRFAPRRTTWESIRDSALQVAGNLRPTAGGRSIAGRPDSADEKCRTIYLSIDRQNLSSIARDFDFPSPDFTGPARSITTVPQQQLFFMNSPFIRRQAEALGSNADKLELDLPADSIIDPRRASYLFRQILGRQPSDDELAATIAFAAKALDAQGPAPSQETWTRVAHALLQNSEFTTIP